MSRIVVFAVTRRSVGYRSTCAGLNRPRRSCPRPKTGRTGALLMRRPDPYEARARELATAAGFDPDARIERPGQRAMPTWCTFRDAARAEHMAREAAATATEIAVIAPQAAEFQNSPLKI